MADIQLTADGSQAIQTLLKIQASVTALQDGFQKFAGNAAKNLDSVKKNTDVLTNSTENLKNALVSLGIANVIGNFMTYAKEVKGASDATGIAVNTVNDFAKAVGKAGGDTSRAVGDVIDFVAQLNDAKQGSAGAQAELSKMGISLNDLATLSNEDIFKKTLDGLNKMEDASARNALAVKYLGRNFKDINVQEVVGNMGSGKDNSAAINEAAQAMKNLNVIMSSFKQGIISAFAPLINLVSSIGPGAVETFAKIATQIGTLATGMLALNKIVSLMSLGVEALAGYWLLFGRGLKIIKDIVSQFGTVTSIAIGYISNAALILSSTLGAAMGQTVGMSQEMAKLALIVSGVVAAFLAWRTVGLTGLVALGGGLLKLIPFIAGITIAAQIANEAIKIMFDVDIFKWVSGILSEIGDKMLSITKYKKESDNQSAAETKRLKEQNEAAGKQKETLTKVIDAHRGIALEAQKTVETYHQQGMMAARNLGIAVSLIGVDSDRAAQIQKMADLETNYMTEVNNLKQKYIDMQRAAAVGDETEKKAFEAFAAVYNKTLKDIDKEYALQQDRLQQLLNTETILKAREQDRLNAIEAITKQMERQALLGDQLRSANDKMVDIKFSAKMVGGNPLEGLTPSDNASKTDKETFARIQNSSRAIQVEYAKINEEARKAALEAGRAFAAGFEDNGDGLTPERAEELRVGLDKIAKSYKNIADQQILNLETSRTFNAGWKEAFNQYIDDATNAAKIAADEFRAMASVINSAIDNFVDKGEFSFKDFAKSIIAEFVKIELKAATMNLLGAMGVGDLGGGSGGILSGLLGSLFGSIGKSDRGTSASKPMYVMDVSKNMGGAANAVKGAMGGEGLLSKAWSGVKDMFGFGDQKDEYGDTVSGGGIGGAISGVANTIGNFGTGIMDSVGGLFGGDSSSGDSGGGFMDTIGSIASSIGDMFGGWFADGGKPPLGKASIVGENGPELFMPNSAGTIIPNGALSGGGGGQSITNVTNNISALDAKSVAQLLAENKTMIFGIVEQARKGMPSSR